MLFEQTTVLQFGSFCHILDFFCVCAQEPSFIPCITIVQVCYTRLFLYTNNYLFLYYILNPGWPWGPSALSLWLFTCRGWESQRNILETNASPKKVDQLPTTCFLGIPLSQIHFLKWRFVFAMVCLQLPELVLEKHWENKIILEHTVREPCEKMFS